MLLTLTLGGSKGGMWNNQLSTPSPSLSSITFTHLNQSVNDQCPFTFRDAAFMFFGYPKVLEREAFLVCHV